jgi:hypothetical protein
MALIGWLNRIILLIVQFAGAIAGFPAPSMANLMRSVLGRNTASDSHSDPVTHAATRAALGRGLVCWRTWNSVLRL